MTTTTTMPWSGDFDVAPELGYEEWREVIRSIVGQHNPKGIQPDSFAGRVKIRDVYGFCVDQWDHNTTCIERTQRDVRVDDVEFYHIVFQVAGRSTIVQNDRAANLDVGEVTLVDSTRPVTFLNEAPAQWLSVRLPRRSLISHLGLEPEGASTAQRGSRAGSLLFQLLLDEFRDDPVGTRSSIYMQLAIYDLIGELFAPSDRSSASLYTDKQFDRVCAIIKDRFTDAELRPHAVAAEAGISVRYLQKLFTQRGSTCGGFIDTLRLTHAKRLLQRRALTNTRQPISEIAYASGFNDYNYFAQKFRRSFGHAPSAHTEDSPPDVKPSKN